MKTTYFKIVVQKTTPTHSILMAVIPNDMLGELPLICDMEAFVMPKTIYTGTYPQIKINTDTIRDRTEDLKSLGAHGILTHDGWATKEVEQEDVLGVGI